ncbi:MAG: hypothetical protein KDB01_25890 [Planctomycetaceae bacterium]|nr:hypothetical protein [Planctomycetaceae bacterium]
MVEVESDLSGMGCQVTVEGVLPDGVDFCVWSFEESPEQIAELAWVHDGPSHVAVARRGTVGVLLMEALHGRDTMEVQIGSQDGYDVLFWLEDNQD